MGLDRAASDVEPFTDLLQREVRREERGEPELGSGERRSRGRPAGGVSSRTLSSSSCIPSEPSEGRCWRMPWAWRATARAPAVSERALYTWAISISERTDTTGRAYVSSGRRRAAHADGSQASSSRPDRCAIRAPQANTGTAGPVLVEGAAIEKPEGVLTDVGRVGPVAEAGHDLAQDPRRPSRPSARPRSPPPRRPNEQAPVVPVRGHPQSAARVPG